MISSIIERDALTGVETWHHYDPATDVTTIEERMDVQPILEANREKTNRQTSAPVRAGVPHLAPIDWQGIQNGWHHVASIDPITQMEWMKEGIFLWRWGRCDWTTRKIKQKLNSPDWKRLRVGNARL